MNMEKRPRSEKGGGETWGRGSGARRKLQGNSHLGTVNPGTAAARAPCGSALAPASPAHSCLLLSQLPSERPAL